jgi:hypothetical protein
MKVRKIEFWVNGAAWHPKDLDFFQRVDKFCQAEMANKPVLANYTGAWAVEAEDGEILAVGGLQLIPDVHIRVKQHEQSQEAMQSLVARMNDHLADNGYYGKEVLVFKAANEAPEQECPNWEFWLRKYGAKPADRYIVSVK